MIALPLLLLFGILLGSADPIFGEYLGQLGRLFEIENFEELMPHLMLIAILGWAACGAIVYAATQNTYLPATPESAAQSAPAANADPFADLPAQDATPSAPAGLGMIEAGIVLGSVDLLFGAFVGIQFAYFFGGRVNVAADALTYAEYARRGFFELVAVAALTLGLALALDLLTVRNTPTQHAIFRVLAVIVVALTGIMLLSAWQRMSLYEHEYGFTHLRLYTHLFMLWMGVLFGFFLLSLFRVREHIFSLGVLVCLIGYLVTLNLVNPDYTIAERNVARYQEGYPLDVITLDWLSADMIPALVPVYLDSAEDSQVHGCVAQILGHESGHPGRTTGRAERHALLRESSRAQAWALLEPLRAELPAYTAGYLDLHDCADATREARAGTD